MSPSIGMRRKRKNFYLGIFLSFLLLLGAFLLALATGDVPIPVDHVGRILLSHIAGKGPSGDRIADAVVWDIRLPRAIASMSTGGVLSICGVLFQGVLLNPLAEPYTLGLSSGAALGASCAILLGFPFIPLAALCGGLLSFAGVLILGRRSQGADPTRIILAGVIVGSILGAAITLVEAIAGDQTTQIILWLLGSFSGADWVQAKVSLLALLLAGGAGFVAHRTLDILSSGAPPSALGVSENRTRIGLLFVGSLAASLVVSYFGVIGFVGLVAPHLIRLLFGPTHSRLLPLAILLGGAWLVAADTVSRLAGELPIGVVTALVGGPIFCLILWRRL